MRDTRQTEQDAARRQAHAAGETAAIEQQDDWQQHQSRLSSRLLGHRGLSGLGNAPVRAAVIQSMQANNGNRQARVAVQRAVIANELDMPMLPAVQEDPLYTRMMENQKMDEMSDEERESYKADQMWGKLYDEYEDLRPHPQIKDPWLEEGLVGQ